MTDKRRRLDIPPLDTPTEVILQYVKDLTETKARLTAERNELQETNIKLVEMNTELSNHLQTRTNQVEQGQAEILQQLQHWLHCNECRRCPIFQKILYNS